jgi:NTE family protein
VTFYESRGGYHGESADWSEGVRTALTVEHLLASSAVPFLFPAIRMGGEYYGDGAMRQLAPLSPAIQLGADSVFVIGVRSMLGAAALPVPHPADAPSVGQIIGFMLDTLFIDSLQSSIAQLDRINRLIAHRLPGHHTTHRLQRYRDPPRAGHAADAAGAPADDRRRERRRRRAPQLPAL